MTHSIEGILTTEEKLVRAVQTLASSAMGIEESLNKIHDRLDGIEDSFVGLSVTANVDGLGHVKQSINDVETALQSIADQLDHLA